MALTTPSPPQKQPRWSHCLCLLSAQLAGINTITITWSPRGQPACHLPPPLASLAASQGCWGWRHPELLSRDTGRVAGQAVLRRSCGGPGDPVLSPQLLTCGPQANLHTTSLEFTAALMLGHNEVAAAMDTGYEGGQVTVLAAVKQDSEGETPRGCVPSAGHRKCLSSSVGTHRAQGQHISVQCLLHTSLWRTCGQPHSQSLRTHLEGVTYPAPPKTTRTCQVSAWHGALHSGPATVPRAQERNSILPGFPQSDRSNHQTRGCLLMRTGAQRGRILPDAHRPLI